MPTRRGITLVELLVVLGLMVALSTIGITAFASANRVSRLTATRDLVSDVLRQARTTARTSGQPVLVRCRNGSPGQPSYLQGLMAQILYSHDFEVPDPSDPPEMPPHFRTPLGRSGQGFQLPPGTDATLSQDRPLLTGRAALRPQDGFLLQVSVKPPTASPSATTQPLVQLSTGNDDGLVLGLRLVPIPLALYAASPPSVHAQPATTWNPSRSTWMAQGWIQRANGTTVISEYRWPIDQTSNPWSPTADARDTAHLRLLQQAGGSTWTSIGLLWDRHHLRLLVDGKPRAEQPVTGDLDIPTGDQRLILGHATYNDTWNEGSSINLPTTDWTPEGQRSLSAGGVLDEVILMRLGEGEQQRLPAGITVDQEVDLFFFPDGRLDLRPASLTNPNTSATPISKLTFRGIAEDQDSGVTFVLSPTTSTITTISTGKVDPKP